MPVPSDFPKRDPANRRTLLSDRRAGLMTDRNELVSKRSGWQVPDAFDISDADPITGQRLIGVESTSSC